LCRASWPFAHHGKFQRREQFDGKMLGGLLSQMGLDAWGVVPLDEATRPFTLLMSILSIINASQSSSTKTSQLALFSTWFRRSLRRPLVDDAS
jgi:hypothetical protein